MPRGDLFPDIAPFETGFLPPAPDEGACTWCDFRPVCGSAIERRSRHKAQEPMADLVALRRKP